MVSVVNSVSRGVGKKDEWKRGTLTHGSGEKVADRNISLSLDRHKISPSDSGPNIPEYREREP